MSLAEPLASELPADPAELSRRELVASEDHTAALVKMGRAVVAWRSSPGEAGLRMDYEYAVAVVESTRQRCEALRREREALCPG